MLARDPGSFQVPELWNGDAGGRIADHIARFRDAVVVTGLQALETGGPAARPVDRDVAGLVVLAEAEMQPRLVAVEKCAARE